MGYDFNIENYLRRGIQMSLIDLHQKVYGTWKLLYLTINVTLYESHAFFKTHHVFVLFY